MQKINLREYYPNYYTEDNFIEVPDQLAQELEQFRRYDNAVYLRRYRNKAYYSLDRADGIENRVLFTAATPDELYERKLNHQQLHAALASFQRSRPSASMPTTFWTWMNMKLPRQKALASRLFIAPFAAQCEISKKI